MKKLIAVLSALCLLTGFSTDCIPEVVEIFSDPAYSVAEKRIAIEVVTEQLEDLYNCLANGENPYAQGRNCNPDQEVADEEINVLA